MQARLARAVDGKKRARVPDELEAPFAECGVDPTNDALTCAEFSVCP